ncbi:deaminated glutathione amidase [Cloeon dipterum]|uniref:deaminated glutathione amidase n=1 Tax=Cloeon dipterum TaxID=197152 RepID=UPI00321FDA6E
MSRPAQILLSAVRKMSHKTRIAVCQINAKADKEENFNICKSLIEEAANAKAQMVFLPEACDYIAESKEETLKLSEPLNGTLIGQYQTLAKKLGIWLSLGGFHERTENDKMHVAHVIFNSKGEIVSVYRKAHLFAFGALDESKYIVPGSKVEEPVETPVGKLGLLICYDLRFPEISLQLLSKGAEILTFPSAFTAATGQSHWESLLRARAIETQSYVVAAAQTGCHGGNRNSYGHAMVVDPWGAVVAQCSEGTGLALAQIDLESLKSIRTRMPVVEHRRPDLYPTDLRGPVHSPANEEIFTFGQVKVLGASVVAKTALTIAFTNKKCVVPGHMLLAPIRVAERLNDLTPVEIADLFQLARKIQHVMEKIHGASSSTLAVQDGPEAGRTIKHVHVHVMPRKKDDFKWNDEVYRELAKHDKPEDTGRWRTEEEMADEAKSIRLVFRECGFFDS